MSVVATAAEIKPSAADVPPNFYRGARFTWHQRRRHALVRRLMKGLEGRRVLDYGCGYGDLTYAISKSNSVVGIDIDVDRVAFARSQYPELEFHAFDGEAAPFPDRSFDVVLSCVVLPFVPDHETHLGDVRRLLTKGGQLVLLSKNLAVVQGVLRRLTGRPPVRPRLNVESIDSTRTKLSKLGFAIEANDYFYDPPFIDGRRFGDIAISTVEQLLSLTQISFAAHYFGFRARVHGMNK